MNAESIGGVFTVSIDPADTLDLVGLYHHEVELTSGIGTVSTSTTGTMTIVEDLIQ